MKKRLNRPLIAALVAIFVLLGFNFAQFFSIEKRKIEHLERIQFLTKNNILSAFNNYIAGKKSELAITTELLTAHLGDPQALTATLATVQKATGSEIAYIGLPGRPLITADATLAAQNDIDVTARAWYKGAAERGGFFVSEPYESIYQGLKGYSETIISYSAPLLKGGEMVGVVGLDDDFERMRQAVFGGADEGFIHTAIYTTDGTIAFHQEKAKILTKDTLSKNLAATVAKNRALLDGKFFRVSGDGYTPMITTCSVIDERFFICSSVEATAYN